MRQALLLAALAVVPGARDDQTGQDFGISLLDGKIIALQPFGSCSGTLPAPDDPEWAPPPRG